MTDNRFLIEGQDIRPSASLKLARARQHFNELAGLIDRWGAARETTCPIRLTPDRLFLEFLKPVGARPPLSEWGIILGDAIHNLRSALDSLTWEFAHLDGKVPSNPRTVAFPVVRAPESWPPVAQRLASVPDDVLARLEAVQPFKTEGPPGQWHFLEALNELDNRHKHRIILQAAPTTDSLQFGGEGKLQVDDSRRVSDVGIECCLDIDSVPPDAPIARFTFGAPLTVDSVIPQQAYLSIGPILDVNGSLMPPSAIYQYLHTNTQAAIAYLLTGEHEQASFEGSQPTNALLRAFEQPAAPPE